MKTPSLLPVDILLPENTPLEGGARFVRLPTREALESFWAAHRATLPYAARGVAYGPYQVYLREDEWVFAPTKATLVRTVTRWDQVGIVCRWYDWASDEPNDHASFFRELPPDELQGRTPETYRGWWVLDNLPDGTSDSDWFEGAVDEVSDPALPLAEVLARLQAQTFDAWKHAERDVWLMDAGDVDQHLVYRREHEAEEAAIARFGLPPEGPGGVWG